ncbi:response regulator [Oxalobacteraceae bacterium OM1]|nr:response regulator [Oxalobacteraceae bacterium OM1]
MDASTVPALAFLADGGETGALMRAHDWSQSPLGSPESWPQSLRSIVGLLLNSKFPMFVAWGSELGFLYNDRYAEILGAKHPAAIGRRFDDIWAEIWDDIHPIIVQAMQGNASYHENLPLTMNRKGYDEQTWFTFSYSPVRDESGQVAGMFCAVTETTEQVLAERHRAEELERLRHLFQQAPGIIAVLREPDHVFEIANEAYLQLVGHRDILGKPVRDALPEITGQGFFELLDRVYETGEPYIGRELPVRLRLHPDGPLEKRFVSFVYQPTLDHRGKINGIFVEGSDVTESVKAHQALRESENELKAANRRKDEFLAMLAHELRNPLAPIATAAELLKLATLDKDRVRKTSDVIARQVAHMTELVDDLLDVSRVTRGLVTLQEEALSISGLLADAAEQVRSLMEAKRHHFTVQVPDEQYLVRGDRTRLVQVFSNILNNAAKYTPPNGHITLRVRADDTEVEVAVEDDGIGIAPTLLPHIFDLFTQAERSPDRSQGGLGLGLALVKSLLELQGGHVSAYSAGAGKGSRFTVRLPRVMAADSRPEHDHDNHAQSNAARLRVLVVDDNKDAAEMLQFLLEANGHEVITAFTAQDGLTVARRISPAILFLDIGLPDMDGYALARRLRSLPETADATLIALTGYGQPQDKERAREAGFDHHLVKPVKLGDVLALLPGMEG